MGVNMTLRPMLHGSPRNMSALLSKYLKTEDCVATCGIVIPRYDRSILVLWMDVIQFPFDNVMCGGLFVCARVLVLYNDQIHLNLQFIL